MNVALRAEPRPRRDFRIEVCEARHHLQHALEQAGRELIATGAK